MQRWWTLGVLVVAVGTASCSHDPETAKRKFLENGDRYLGEKKYREAIVEYRNALKEDPKFGEARLKLTDAYLGTGDVRNGLAESVRAADVLSDNVAAQLRAGSLLLLARQYPEAKQRALNALEREPANPQALILLGNSLAGLRDLDGAIQQIEDAIAQDPKLTITYTNLANLFAAKGDKDAAEQAFENAVKVAPNSLDSHLAFANFLWAQKRWPEAERELKAAVGIQPKSAAVNRALAAFYASQNRPSEALSYLETYAAVMGTVEARLLLADYYVSTKNTPRATQVLNELAKDPRGLSQATVRLALLDFREGRPAEAYKRLDAVLAKDSKDVLTLQGKARLLLQENRGQEALKVTQTLIATDPELPANQFLHAMALEGTGSLEAATAMYLEVLKADGSSAQVKERLAKIYLRRQDPKEALVYADQLVKGQPESGTAHLLYAQALLQSGNVARAEKELAVLSKVAPSSPDVLTLLGMLYEGKHDTARARQAYQKAFELEPAAIVALSGLTSVDLTEKKASAAIERIDSQLAAKPDNRELLMLRALTLMTLRDLPKAAAAYEKVIDVAPDSIEAYGRLAAIYLAQNRLDDAKVKYEDILKRQPKNAPAETLLGMILVHQSKTVEAREHFKRALEIDPQAVVASNNLAWDYATNGGDLDVALQLAQTAKARLPENASVTDTLGWVYYKKGLTSLAISTLRQAASLDASNGGIQYRLALALIQQGDKVEAKRVLEHAVKLTPSLASDEGVKGALATVGS